MRIRKAVVTAAGWGTRFLPATKAQPKEMLPLVDKPSIQYVIEEAIEAGITQVIVVTALGKRAIEDHFDRSLELEAALERKGDNRHLEEVRRISSMADIVYIRQREQLGLGHAIAITRSLIGAEPFAVFLPDDIIVGERPCIAQMIDVHARHSGSVIAVERVPDEALGAYGVVEPKPLAPRVSTIQRLVEKPAPGEAPSNLGIVGRYILEPEIFDELDRIEPGRNGEIQLTDGLASLLKRQPLFAYEFEGTRYDTGTPLGFLKASVELALRRPDIAPQFAAYLRELDVARFVAAAQTLLAV